MRLPKKLARVVKWSLVLAIAAMALVVFGLAALLGSFWMEVTSDITLPKPTGASAVGRVEFDWVDENRIDSLAPAARVKRELPVWIWYPVDAAEASRHPTVKYVPDLWLAAEHKIEQASPKPWNVVLMRDFLSRDASLVHAHAVENAPLSASRKRYPVVLFKPGMGAVSTDYTTLCEDIASHGYIVVACDSPYSTGLVVYSDGRVVMRSPAGHIDEDTDPAQAKQSAEKLISIWADDLHFILDRLGEIDNNGSANLFAGRLNLSAVGAFGHSFGGATAAQFCHDDPRCLAGIDIDGIPFGSVVADGVRKPFLFITEPLGDSDSDPDPEGDEMRQGVRSITASLSNWPNHITVRGTGHFNFSDDPFLKERFIFKLAPGFLGPIDRTRALAVTADYVRAFFDTYLEHKPDELMRGMSARHPEVQITPK